MTDARDEMPLAGVVVADFSRVLAGPLAAGALARTPVTHYLAAHRQGEHKDEVRQWLANSHLKELDR